MVYLKCTGHFNRSGTKFVLLMVILAFIVITMQSCNNPNKSDLTFTGKEDFADSAMSQVRLFKDDKGREVLQKNNTYYDFVNFIDTQNVKEMMIKITKAETSFIDSNTAIDHFIVNVSNVSGTKAGWKKDLAGTDIDYTNKVMVVHTEGRNPGEEDTYTQYSLLNGDKLMTYTYGQMMALIPGTSNKRFFGYLSKQSATTDKPESFGVVSYVGSNEVIDKIAIKLKTGNDIPLYTPELKMLVTPESGNTIANDGKTVILGHASRNFKNNDINNLAMQINYYLPNVSEPVSIIIPVINDHLSIDSATYAKGVFELSEMH